MALSESTSFRSNTVLYDTLIKYCVRPKGSASWYRHKVYCDTIIIYKVRVQEYILSK